MPPTPRQLPHEARPTEAELDAAFGKEPGFEPATPIGDKQLHDKSRWTAEELDRLRRQLSGGVTLPAGFELHESPEQRGPVRNVDTQLAAFQAEWPKIEASETAKVTAKEGKQGYSYQYAGLDLVAGKVSPLLGRHGLAFSAQPTIAADGRSLELRYQLRHGESGTKIEGVLPLPTNPANPQALGSMITYFRRYALLAITNTFPGGEDDDGSAAKAYDERQRMDWRRAEADRSTRENRREQGQLRDSVNRAQQANRQQPNGPVNQGPRDEPEPVADIDTAGYPGADEAGDEPPTSLSLGQIATILHGDDTDPHAYLLAAASDYLNLTEDDTLVEISPADTDDTRVHGKTLGGIWARRVETCIAASHRLDTLSNVYRAVKRSGCEAVYQDRLMAKKDELEKKGTPQ